MLLDSPLYNAELAPPEVRGLLIAMQQLATTIGIMSAYWICYGTNYIGGTGDGQSEMAWRLPLIIQGVPAVALAVGVWFLPYSPRLLVKRDRDDEALKVLSRLRQLPPDDGMVQIEYLTIKSESLFEEQNLSTKYPGIAAKTGKNRLIRELAQYALIFRSKDAFKRVALGALVMFFQQWSGIDSSLSHPPLHIVCGDKLTAKSSHLLRSYCLQKPWFDEQHHLTLGYRRCRYYQRGDHNPSYSSD